MDDFSELLTDFNNRIFLTFQPRFATMKTTVTDNKTKAQRPKRQAEPKRPVSQKFYDDISDRVGRATQYLCDHRTQYLMIMHIIDGYMAGGPAPDRSDGIDALMAFALVQPSR